ncbi:MAG: 3-hydroxybutyryl-CoA dehydrogenase [Euryarchaeota archaeon]|nr:3-hydroxybutyryl-CoA dehydrogenase [Euryarchaeota archaeon]
MKPKPLGRIMAIERVAVIGAGTMGAGIAQVCAQAGWTTTLYDAFPEGLERGMQRIDAFWDKGIARGKTTPEQKETWAKNLRAESDMKTAVHDADLVIEAVPEIMEIKARIFHVLSIETKEDCILATNTSSLSISDIAQASDRPDKVIGMHFFNPVPIMELLELVRHDGCSEETIALAQAAGEAMKKTTILVKDIPGFATSRLGVVLGNEAIRMLADGVASAEDIDKAMVLGYKHPMGPLRLTDLVGLDVRRDILLNLQQSFNDDRYAPHPLLEEMVEKGQLGKKSGQGFFDWD